METTPDSELCGFSNRRDNEGELSNGYESFGTVVHYAVGATAGVVYGTAAELLPGITAGVGLPYGAAFWLAIDEGLVPLLGLSKAPTAYPLSTHFYAFASHLVFGATAEGVRRVLRR